MAAITTTAAAASSSFLRRRPGAAHHPLAASLRACHHRYRLACRAAEVSGAEPSAAPAAAAEAPGGGGASWVPVVPLAALPRGERRVIVQDGEEILLLWYKDQVFAIENRSPAEGAYTEASSTPSSRRCVSGAPGLLGGMPGAAARSFTSLFFVYSEYS